jgi:hypothetical protein
VGAAPAPAAAGFAPSPDMATKVNILFYGDAREGLIKAISD